MHRPGDTARPAGSPADGKLPPRAAIASLVDSHGGRLYAVARRLCRGPGEAEDLVQETFLQALRKWGQFRGEGDPAAWLFTIAARICQRMHRRRAGEPTRIDSLDELSPFAESRMAEPDPGPLRAESIERVGAAVAALPLPFRLCVVLKEILGLPVATVARILGVKPATVKTRLHRARLVLRKALEGTLPSRPATPPAYARQVCVDLLRTKQDALDRGVDAPELRDLICERCRSVFATLDVAQDACEQLARGELPEELRRRILTETD